MEVKIRSLSKIGDVHFSAIKNYFFEDLQFNLDRKNAKRIQKNLIKFLINNYGMEKNNLISYVDLEKTDRYYFSIHLQEKSAGKYNRDNELIFTIHANSHSGAVDNYIKIRRAAKYDLQYQHEALQFFGEDDEITTTVKKIDTYVYDDGKESKTFKTNITILGYDIDRKKHKASLTRKSNSDYCPLYLYFRTCALAQRSENAQVYTVYAREPHRLSQTHPKHKEYEQILNDRKDKIVPMMNELVNIVNERTDD